MIGQVQSALHQKVDEAFDQIWSVSLHKTARVHDIYMTICTVYST